MQLHGIQQNRGSSCEGSWTTKRQFGSSCTSPDVMAFMGHAVQGGHIEHRFGGHVRTIHHRGVCDWLQEVAGLPATRHQAEKRHVRRGHLDRLRQPGSSCTSPDVEALMGSEDTSCKVAMLNIGLEDMLAHFAVSGWLQEDAVPQPRGIKQSRGSSGEGIWITTRKPGSSCTPPDVLAFISLKDIIILFSVAILKRTRSHTSTCRSLRLV